MNDKYQELKVKIAELHSKGFTDITIGNIVGKSVSVVQYHRSNLNLPCWGKLGKYKTCTDCLHEFPIDNFQWKQKSRNHKCPRCRDCESIYSLNKRTRYKDLNKSLTATGQRTCNSCNLTKNCLEFYRNNSSSTGFRSVCKVCYDLNEKQDLQLSMWRRAKQRVKSMKIPFDLLPEDLILPSHCPILGVPLIYKGSMHKFNASLDKIIPEKGYTKGNIIVMSRFANTMKQNASLDQLEMFCDNILKLSKYVKLNGALGDITDVFPDIKLLEI